MDFKRFPNDTTERIEKAKHAWCEAHDATLFPALNSALSRSESPIEKLFLLHLIGNQALRADSPPFYLFHLLAPDEIDRLVAGGGAYLSTVVAAGDLGYLHVQPGCPDPDKKTVYRLDFGIGIEGTRVAVELDGHEWHEKTKEQAARDKRRDRILSTHGWLVLHFTGSEIFRDVRRCVKEVARTVYVDQIRRHGESLRTMVLWLFVEGLHDETIPRHLLPSPTHSGRP